MTGSLRHRHLPMLGRDPGEPHRTATPLELPVLQAPPGPPPVPQPVGMSLPMA